jgi:hypothetical protein
VASADVVDRVDDLLWERAAHAADPTARRISGLQNAPKAPTVEPGLA